MYRYCYQIGSSVWHLYQIARCGIMSPNLPYSMRLNMWWQHDVENSLLSHSLGVNDIISQMFIFNSCENFCMSHYGQWIRWDISQSVCWKYRQWWQVGVTEVHCQSRNLASILCAWIMHRVIPCWNCIATCSICIWRLNHLVSSFHRLSNREQPTNQWKCFGWPLYNGSYRLRLRLSLNRHLYAFMHLPCIWLC